jgi:hypothetical protein
VSVYVEDGERDVMVATDSDEDIGELLREREDGRRMNPARGGAKSDSGSEPILLDRDPCPLDEEDETVDMEDDELLGDRLGVEGDRRAIDKDRELDEDAETGMTIPDFRMDERENAGALLSAKVGFEAV